MNHIGSSESRARSCGPHSAEKPSSSSPSASESSSANGLRLTRPLSVLPALESISS